MTQIAGESVQVTGIWLDAYSGVFACAPRSAAKWKTVIDTTDNGGHISHIVEPSGMVKGETVPMTELKDEESLFLFSISRKSRTPAIITSKDGASSGTATAGRPSVPTNAAWAQWPTA